MCPALKNKYFSPTHCTKLFTHFYLLLSPHTPPPPQKKPNIQNPKKQTRAKQHAIPSSHFLIVLQ